LYSFVHPDLLKLCIHIIKPECTFIMHGYAMKYDYVNRSPKSREAK